MNFLTKIRDFSLTDSVPDSLYDICLNYLSNNLNIITQYDSTSKWRRLKDDVILPAEICERFLETYQKNNRVSDYVAQLFGNHAQTRLTAVKLRNSRITDEGFRALMEHKPRELDLVQCEYLSQASLDIINSNSENLLSLRIGPQTYVLSRDESNFLQRGYIINAPKLKRLALQRRGLHIVMFIPLLLVKPLGQLTHLDLSECTLIGSIWALSELKNLYCLILHNFNCTKDVIEWITTLTTLHHLDVSQINEKQGKFVQPNEVLAEIVLSLPYLEYLDISGTNLAGTGAAMVSANIGGRRRPSSVRCDIPGLVSRVNHPLDFLGLYGTHHGACKRHDIPAKWVRITTSFLKPVI